MNRRRIYLNTAKGIRGLNVKISECWKKDLISGALLTSAGICDLLVVVEIARAKLQQNMILSSVG